MYPLVFCKDDSVQRIMIGSKVVWTPSGGDLMPATQMKYQGDRIVGSSSYNPSQGLDAKHIA